MNIIELVRSENMGKVFGCDFNKDFRYRVVASVEGVELEAMTMGKNSWHKATNINSNILSWEFCEVGKKVSFADVLESRGKCKVVHDYVDYMEMGYFDDVMEYLAINHSSAPLKEIILHGDWYIE